MKLSRRAIDGQQFGQVFGPVSLMTETQGEKLIIYSFGVGKPVQWAKKRGNIVMLWRFEDNTCRVILNFFSLSKRCFGIQARRATVIDSWKTKSANQGSGWVNRKIMANDIDSAELRVCCSANAQDMLFERQCLDENDTEAVNRWRKRNIDLIDLHRRRERRMVVKLFRCSEHKFRFVIIEPWFVMNRPCFEVCDAIL